MKKFIVLFSLLMSASVSHADGVFQRALQAALNSSSLATVTKQFPSFELTSAEVKVSETRPRRGTSYYTVSLFYSALGTAGGCNVDVEVARSQMEIVAPGGGGFRNKEIFTAEAKLGICPR